MLYVLLDFMLCIFIEEYVLFRIKQQTDHVLYVYRMLYNASDIFVTPHHQMRHKSEIQKLRFLIDLGNVLYSGIANMRKMGLKIALFTIRMLIYIKLTYRQ